MRSSLTFSKYVAKNFVQWFFVVSFVLATIISLFNVVEIVRRAYNKPNVGLKQVVILAFYQLPDLLNQLLPFIILFSTMLLLWHMNRRSELVVARSLGLSIWSILWPVWVTIVGFSILNFSVFNPISAEFSTRFEQMEKDLLTGRSSLLMISQSGLWLKQEENRNYSLVRVARLDSRKKDLQGVTLYSFDKDNRFVNRLDADEVSIHPQGWFLKDALLSEADKAPEKMGDLLWKTDLTLYKIQESFASPVGIPLWKLPIFIQLMDNAGLSSIDHLQYFYTQLFMPFLFLTMATLAGICAYHFTRKKGGLHFVVTGLGSGFFIFFVHKISHAMGVSMNLPLFLSVLAPVLIGVLASISLLLHLEEK
jgi:lipopolysaccharide export system permease protein